MELEAVQGYLAGLPLQLNGSDNQGIQVHGRDNIVQLFNVNGVFRIWLSILQGGRGVYNCPCIRFYIYSHRTRENGAIGLWLRKKFENYLLLNQTDLSENGEIVHPAFGRDVEGHVLGIIVSGTKNWQNLVNFDDNVQTNIQNIYNILQGFFNEINVINANDLENEIIQYNQDNKDRYNAYINNPDNQDYETDETEAANQGPTQETSNPPHNLIYFGAPGTGKSYKLNESLKDFDFFERVTFYPTYSYAQFVGTYKPVMKADGEGNEEITYQFVPGPFLRVLVQALKNKEANYCLVIEEINRANAAAVFGDVFQLLDRNSDGKSEYSIAASEDIKKYLINEDKDIQAEILSIPKNMYIWATMNSADQGVFPMDTAFKRRWSFEYIEIDEGVTNDCKRWKIDGTNINWNDFRRFVNGLLSSFDVNEDKLMGPFFVKADNGTQISEKSFASKVLMYLWEDAARMIRKNIFGAEIKTYSQLVLKWNSNDRNSNNIHIFDNCSDKWRNNNDLSTLYNNIITQQNAQTNTQAEGVIPVDNNITGNTK